MAVERQELGRELQRFEDGVLNPKLEELKEEIFEKMGETKTDGVVLTEYMRTAKENVILENKVEQLEKVIEQKDLEIKKERDAKEYYRRGWQRERSKIIESTPTSSTVKFSVFDNILFIVFILLVLLGGLKVGELIATLIRSM